MLAKRSALWAGRGKGDAHAILGFGHPGGDLEEPEPQGRELGRLCPRHAQEHAAEHQEGGNEGAGSGHHSRRSRTTTNLTESQSRVGHEPEDSISS